MKLKSLLLGSAAVLVAVSGARAADAIVVEPEPVEYVRVCDAYGAGWWYIPGTEYCLKFDGDVRVQYGAIDYHDYDGYQSNHEWNYRARLNVRANNETEYGTLATRIRFVSASSEGTHYDVGSYNEGPGSADTYVDWAVISLAGFRLGFADNYWSTAGSYGYYNARFDGPYNFGQALFFDYTWAGNGWTATVGVQDGNNSGTSGQPDVYGGITYSGGGWYFAGIAYYDSAMYSPWQGDTESGVAWKFRADYDFGTNGFAIGGWYMSDGGDTDYVKGHAWAVTAKMNLTDNMVLFGGYGAYDDQYNEHYTYVTANNTYNFAPGSYTTWTAGISWNIVPGLLIQPEYTAVAYDNDGDLILGGTDFAGDSTVVSRLANYGRWSLRVVRSF